MESKIGGSRRVIKKRYAKKPANDSASPKEKLSVSGVPNEPQLVSALTSPIQDCDEKHVFYITRIIISVITSLCESVFISSINDNMGGRVALHTFISLIFGAGMYHSGSSFLPGTLSMQLIMLAFSWGMISSPTLDFLRGLTRATICLSLFSVACIWGWPYAGVLLIPWIFEHIFVRGSETFDKDSTILQIKDISKNWRIKRVFSLTISSAISLLLVLTPSMLFDSNYYGRLVLPSLNQVIYNIFPKLFLSDQSKVLGPNLYGTEPWYFYLVNGFLNWNFIFIFSLLTIPLLFVQSLLSEIIKSNASNKNEDSVPSKKLNEELKALVTPTSTTTLVCIRALPVTLMVIILSLQPHKEERFLVPMYPLICLCSSISFETLRVISTQMTNLSQNFIKLQDLEYGARTYSWLILLISSAISISRSLAIYNNYSSSMLIYNPLFNLKQSHAELPIGTSLKKQILNTLKLSSKNENNENTNYSDNKKVCIGKDWYRFPSHFFLPDNFQLVFLKSKFDGLLPGDFVPVSHNNTITESTSKVIRDTNCLNEFEPSHVLSGQPEKFCDYLIDIDYSESIDKESGYYMDTDTASKFEEDNHNHNLEPNFSKMHQTWDIVECLPFLNPENSPLWVRSFYTPYPLRLILDKLLKKEPSNRWGNICLLKPSRK
ncbi:Alpha-1,2-mannosyltransferase ALG9 [Smittium culicis]|uniref:Mannosyltransferase n=1 Tax=Smittium culicis TaxID=133412 RepID=A0A1R1XDR2_9FUNG|nr:Alpha-1,2-mannosyltransferase ALG9 [Smittium culicis]